jgi:hypothetical protein
MGKSQAIFAVERCGGATGSHVNRNDVSHVTGSDVSHPTGSDVSQVTGSLNIGRGRRREYSNQHSLLLIRDCTTSSSACAHPIKTRRGSSNLRSHRVAMLLLYYYKEENAGKNRSCAEHSYGQGHFRTEVGVFSTTAASYV